MKRSLARIAIVVADYNEAIDFYTKKLPFELVEDTVLSPVKRWVLIKPKGSEGCCLLLAKAAGEVQQKYVGNQTGRCVFLFLHTDDFEKDYQNLLLNKVKITRQPTSEVYGKVAVFEDLHGNLWDLVQPSDTSDQ